MRTSPAGSRHTPAPSHVDSLARRYLEPHGGALTRGHLHADEAEEDPLRPARVHLHDVSTRAAVGVVDGRRQLTMCGRGVTATGTG